MQKKLVFKNEQLTKYSHSKKKGKKEVQVYQYNVERGNFYTIEEMKQFILGEQHADSYHRSTFTKISAVAVGSVAGYFMADGGGVIAASPIVYSTVMMIPKVHLQRNNYNGDLRNIASYRAGYSRVSKGKRFLNNLAYSAIGMIGSFVLFEYTDASL